MLAALRAAVVDQILELKNEFFRANPDAVCPLTGEPLGPDSCHVDHQAPVRFQVLSRRFLEGLESQRGIPAASIRLVGYRKLAERGERHLCWYSVCSLRKTETST